MAIDLINLLALIQVSSGGNVGSIHVRISRDVRSSADSAVVCCLLTNFLHEPLVLENLLLNHLVLFLVIIGPFY